jgi:hypothetical protein
LAVVYTCPSGKTAILKDIRVSANQAGAVSRCVVAWISGPSQGAFCDTPLNALQTASFGAFAVLEPGDQLAVYATGNNFSFLLSGSELDGVA